MPTKLISLAAVAAAALTFPASAEAGDWSVRVTYGHRHRPQVHVRRAPVVRGHWEVRRVKVWVDGYHRREVRPAVYKRVWDTEHCEWISVRVRRRRVVLVWVPAHHEYRRKRVWVPAPVRRRC